MKTYFILVSTKFPSTHKRKGEQTFFAEKINEAAIPVTKSSILGKKLHTIRANYPLWEKRIAEVIAGNAVLSIRYHSLGRYVKGNQQIEFLRLDKDSGIGIQKISFFDSDICCPYVYGNDGISNEPISLLQLTKNDGLEILDFIDWFTKYDKSESMGIIHFTPFRY